MSGAVVGKELADLRLELAPRLRVGEAAQVADIPREPPGYKPRPDLLAELDHAGPRASVVRAVIGMRGVGKTKLAAAYARARLADKWRRVAWVNAKDPGSLLAGLAAVADAAQLTDAASQGASADAGRVVRHWMETDGDRCLVVFDNATNPDMLLPFVPAGGAARVLITSSLRSVANLGLSVGVEVFTREEPEAFLVARTGLTDPAGAAAVAAELGFLPLGAGSGSTRSRSARVRSYSGIASSSRPPPGRRMRGCSAR